MKVKVLMLQDYHSENEVWWKGDIIEVDEVRDQVNLDYMEDVGIVERVVD